MRLRSHANIPPKLEAGHKYEPADEGEVPSPTINSKRFQRGALRVNLSQFKFRLAVTLITVKQARGAPASRPDVRFLFKSHLSVMDDRK